MTDFDSIWRTQDEIRTVVNAVLGNQVRILFVTEKGTPFLRFPGVLLRGICRVMETGF